MHSIHIWKSILGVSCTRHDENLRRIKRSFTSKGLQATGEAAVWAGPKERWGDYSETFRKHHSMMCKGRIIIGKCGQWGEQAESAGCLLDGRPLGNVTFLPPNELFREFYLHLCNERILPSVFQQTPIYLSLKFMLTSLGHAVFDVEEEAFSVD